MEAPYQELPDADDPLASDGSTRVLDAATKGREEWKELTTNFDNHDI